MIKVTEWRIVWLRRKMYLSEVAYLLFAMKQAWYEDYDCQLTHEPICLN